MRHKRQYDHAHLTQPLLRAQLHDWGIEISAGQPNRLLTEGHNAFHEEKAEIKTAGLATSSYLQADDTGARPQGQNGYCTCIGNKRFAWLASTESKSRVNFLELLQAECGYAVNVEALASMVERGLAAGHGERRAARLAGARLQVLAREGHHSLPIRHGYRILQDLLVAPADG